MPKTGRRTKLTPEVQQTIATAIAAGVPFGTACRLAGIHPDSGYAWLQRGAHDQTQGRAPTLFSDFSDAVAYARAQAIARRVARISQAGEGGTLLEKTTTTYADGRTVTRERYQPGDWRADAWFLSRRYPQHWGPWLRVDADASAWRVAQKVAADITATGTPITAAEVLEEARRLLEETDREAGGEDAEP